MRVDSQVFSQRNAELTRSPRYVVELSFAEDNSELWYFTSHDDIRIHFGANMISRVVQAVAVTSQTLNPATAAATIGTISFDLVDRGGAVTAVLGSELTLGRTARRRRVRVYYGFEGMRWFDPAGAAPLEYTLIQTQIVTLVEFDRGVYHFTCADIQREARKEIFVLAKTNLSASLGATRLTAACAGGAATLVVADASAFPASGSGIIRESGVTDKDLFTWAGKTAQSLTGCTGVLAHGIGATVCDAVLNVYDTSAFAMVAHGTSYTDLPSTTAGYVKVDKEVCSYTSKTSTTFLGVVRGALNTFPVEHLITDVTLASDRRPVVEEYVYLELPVVDLAYRILTGKDRFGASVMPTTWHLGIPTTYVRLADFTGIGADLWDLSDDANGLVGFLQDVGRTDGKKFIETEIGLLAGCFLPVHADGSWGFQRSASLLSGAAYTTMLDESNVVSWGPLLHDYEAVRNLYEINWNWEPSQNDFTRKTDLVELDSAVLYKDAPLQRLKFRLLNGRIHTASTIGQRFNALRDRYSGPPQRLTLNGLHRLNQLEVGEVARVRLGNVRDFAAPGGTVTLDRSFEVQSISVNWATGQLAVQLFATSRQAAPLAPTTDATVLTHAYYVSQGTKIVNGTGGLTVSGIHPTHISGTGTLAGNASMIAAGAVYYIDDDVVIDAGAVITLSQNVQLRFEGFCQNNGSIVGRGAGLAGAAAVSAPTFDSHFNAGIAGGVGATEAGGGLSALSFVLKPRINSLRGGIVLGSYSAVPEFNLDWDGTVLAGVPGDLRGCSGSSGMPFFLQPFLLPGGAGGTSGAGLVVICRGFANGASGSIDLSGLDGSPGGFVVAAGNTWHAGSGAGGAPGGLLVLLDGTGTLATGLTDAGFVALQGKTPIVGTRLSDVALLGFNEHVCSDYLGTGDGTTFLLPNLSDSRGGSHTQNIPGNQAPQADAPSPFIFGFDVVTGTLTATQIATETVTGGPGGNIAPTTITGSNLVNLTVTATQIANLTITAAQIANATITGANIASATITGGNIASATITSGNIQDATILAADIASATIVGSNIASATIAGGNIQNVTITATQIANLTITAAQIANATITGGKIVSATITGGLIDAATITGSNISGGTITGSNIAGATITAANIAAATITADRMLVSDLSAISANIGDITAGSIRGVNVNASSHTTKGSYLTSAPGSGAGTLNVKNTADFPASGSGVIIDTTNDRDAFTYTGKTATTLTGCTGVLAHNSGATIIPLAKVIVMDAATNEMRFYGDRGDGTIEELATIGIGSVGGDFIVGVFGTTSAANTRLGVKGSSGTAVGVWGTSTSGEGVFGSSTSGVGGKFFGNPTRGNLLLPNSNGVTPPTDTAANQLAMIAGRLWYTDGGGVGWHPLTESYFESSEQTLTVGSDTAVAHGLPTTPKTVAAYLRCKTAEFGYAVGDEIFFSAIYFDSAVWRGINLYANATNVGFVVNNIPIIFRRDVGNLGVAAVITAASWKLVMRAS